MNVWLYVYALTQFFKDGRGCDLSVEGVDVNPARIAGHEQVVDHLGRLKNGLCISRIITAPRHQHNDVQSNDTQRNG